MRILIVFLVIKLLSNTAFSSCSKLDSVVQMIEKAKKYNESYVVAVATLLPGEKEVINLLEENGRSKGVTVSGALESIRYVRRFTDENLLLNINLAIGNLPQYVDSQKNLLKRKKILIEGFLVKKSNIEYIERSRSCGTRVSLKDGKIEGYITLDSTESMMKRQTMTIKEFKEYFQNLDKKLDNKKK